MKQNGSSSSVHPNHPDPEVQVVDGPNAKKQQHPFLETLRLSCLRLVIASSILTLGFSLYGLIWSAKHTWAMKWTIPGVMLSAVLTLHHIIMAFVLPENPPRWAFFGDACLTLVETLCTMAATGGITFIVASPRSALSAQWFPQFALLGLVGIWILTSSILVLFILKVVLWKKPSKEMSGNINEALDNGSTGIGSSGWFKSLNSGNKLKTLKRGVSSIMGRKMWSESVPGESKWLSYLRGLFALAAVCSLVAYGIYQVVIMPISEIGMTPHHNYRAPGLGWSLTKSLLKPTFQFKVLLVWYRHDAATLSIIDSVNATARWRQQGTGLDELPQAETCTVRGTVVGTLDPDVFDVAVVECPRSPNQGNSSFPIPWWDFPNFDLTVNYTGLLGSSGRVQADRVSDSVRVYLGATADLNDVYSTTEPVSLFPGTDMLSVANLAIRQRLDPASLATLGFETQKDFFFVSVAQTIPDPFAIPRNDPNVATLGFALQTATNGWNVLQDYRDKSVLSGLSALGGLGSTLATFLAVFLGTDLMCSVFSSRPYAYSPLGLLHNIGLRGLQQKMVESFKHDYPGLESDLREAGQRRGIIKYLFETLIDAESLGFDFGEGGVVGTPGTNPAQGPPVPQGVTTAQDSEGRVEEEMRGDLTR